MAKRRIYQLKTTLTQKIVLILFGISLSIVLLEAGLRAAEFTLQSLQEYRNLSSIRRNGEYRIMCIGESTTAGQYPRFLEEALARHDIGIKFTVIDKGIGATDTSFLLGQLENNIERYHPDLVIAMIGINDGASHMPVGFSTDSKTFYKSLKTYRLTKLLILHIQSKAKEMKAAKQDNKAPLVSLKNEQHNMPDIPKIGTVKEKIKDDIFFNNLGKKLSAEGDISSAKHAFEKAISLNPYNVDAYYMLACLSDPDRCRSIMREIYERYKSLVKDGPLNDEQNANIGHLCRTLLGKSMHTEVGELCNEMITKDIMRKDSYIILALSSLVQNRYTAAESYFKEVIKLDNLDSRAFDGLAVVYHETGKYDLSEQYLRKANELRACGLSMVAIRNYKKIKEILDKRKIQLVCVQYPMRSVRPLKDIFETERNVVFVDNEQVFKRAIAQGRYKDFFSDMWAGDFGHCTDKGNKLLAQNIADVISKEIFHK